MANCPAQASRRPAPGKRAIEEVSCGILATPGLAQGAERRHASRSRQAILPALRAAAP